MKKSRYVHANVIRYDFLKQFEWMGGRRSISGDAKGEIRV